MSDINDKIQTVAAHINNYLYELRSTGKEKYAERVRDECTEALTAIAKSSEKAEEQNG